VTVDNGDTVELERLKAEEERLDALVYRLAQALVRIADADYRGNRSRESEIAHRALVAEGLRPTTEGRSQ
jgi:hypothetical protein